MLQVIHERIKGVKSEGQGEFLIGEPGWLRSVAIVLVLAGVLRYCYSAIYYPLIHEPWKTVHYQLEPLLDYLWHDRPLAESFAARTSPWGVRYGPMLYLVAHPLAVLLRSNHGVHYALLVVGHLCFWASLYCIDRRIFSGSSPAIRLLVVGVALNFTPALEAMACTCLDMWEMLAIVVGFFLFTSQGRWQQAVAVVPVMLGVLTKLMPILVLVFLVIRRRVAAIVGCVVLIIVLMLGHFLYGKEMGGGYPLRVIRVAAYQASSGIALWWENDSFRGLIYKTLTGFKLEPGELHVDLDPSIKAAVDGVMMLVVVGGLVLVCWKLWRWRYVEGLEETRILGGFAVGVIFLHLLGMYSTHQYWPVLLLAFAFVLRCAQWRLLSKAEQGMALAALLLIGNVLPKSIFVWLTGMGWLNSTFRSAPSFRPDQMYTFYGFPGLGLVLLAILVVRLQWRLCEGWEVAVGRDQKEPAG